MTTNETPRFLSLELTGIRATLRRWSFFVVAGFAAIAALGYVLPAHRLIYVGPSGSHFDLAAQPGESHFHSNMDDGGVMALIVLLLASLIALLVRRNRRFGSGMLAGFAGAGASLLTIGAILLVHLFSAYETAYGDAVFGIGMVGLFCSSVALFVGEPVLYLLERRRLVRASRPAPLPVAVATSV